MTTVANIKGYINGAEWGVYEPAPELMSCAEIGAIPTLAGALSELNSHPIEYYNKFVSENHISRSNRLLLENETYSNGSCYYWRDNNATYYVKYNTSTNLWESESTGGGPIK